MKTLLRIEEAFLFLLSIFLFSRIGYAWWWFPLLLFAPDIGMLGYLVNPQLGAVIYNFIHHRGVAVILYVLGVLLSIQVLQLIGTILFAHSSLDRVFHFGLKYGDRFKHTHLGE
jgi:hypothetical protein